MAIYAVIHGEPVAMGDTDEPFCAVVVEDGEYRAVSPDPEWVEFIGDLAHGMGDWGNLDTDLDVLRHLTRGTTYFQVRGPYEIDLPLDRAADEVHRLVFPDTSTE